MCVCNIWTDVKLPWLLPFYSCRKPVYICRVRQGRCMAVANEAPCSWLGYGVWSTPRTCFFRHSKGPSSEPQPPWFYSSTVATICSLCIRTFLRFSPKPFRRQCFWIFDIFSPRSCRRWTLGHFGKQSPKHYFGFSTCWSKLYGLWLWLRLTILDALHRFREVPHVAPLLI